MFLKFWQYRAKKILHNIFFCFRKASMGGGGLIMNLIYLFAPTKHFSVSLKLRVYPAIKRGWGDPCGQAVVGGWPATYALVPPAGRTSDAGRALEAGRNHATRRRRRGADAGVRLLRAPQRPAGLGWARRSAPAAGRKPQLAWTSVVGRISDRAPTRNQVDNF